MNKKVTTLISGRSPSCDPQYLTLKNAIAMKQEMCVCHSVMDNLLPEQQQVQAGAIGELNPVKKISASCHFIHPYCILQYFSTQTLQ